MRQGIIELLPERDRPTTQREYTEWLCARHVCLPLYPALSEADADYVVESLATALERDEVREVSGGRISAG